MASAALPPDILKIIDWLADYARRYGGTLKFNEVDRFKSDLMLRREQRWLPDRVAVDLTVPGFLFTNGAGNPVRAQEFFNGGWKSGRDRAMKAGLTKSPWVHDLRHTCASWMIQAGVPLPVIQQHLGHESIQTTIGVYGHLDRRSAQAAADAIGSVLN